MSTADYFLKINGIDGEAEDKKLDKHFELMSFSFGASNSGSAGQGGGLGTGKVNMQDFHFVVKHSKASAKLMGFVASGKHIDQCKLHARKSTGGKNPEDYMVVTFSDVLISSFQTGGSDGSNSLPIDQISFNFTKIKFETKIQDSKGIISNGTEFEYSVKKNDQTI
jgi:type VI secretion system secreted protein Hcp